jgi:hypothetical protein
MNLDNNLILLYDNFLTKEECNKYINAFEKEKDKSKQFRDTFTIKIKDDSLLNKLKTEFNISKFITPHNLEIVMWPKNSFMGLHYDTGDLLAFIIYLNDNFVGGETVIDKKQIEPKTGRVIIFSNGRLEHSVNKIQEGTRYTLIGWYV